MTTRTRRRTITSISLGAMLLFAGCASEPSESAAATPAGWKSYGESVTLTQRTAIADILSHPDDFEGMTVAVEGRVTDVCTMMGCWIEVQGGSRHIRLKVEDGAIVFPQEAVGRQAVLQGKVEKLTYTREEFLAKAKHEAEERGSEFDPDAVEPPYEEIRLWGSGALIEESPPADS